MSTQKTGVTLLEIIVVLVILGILAVLTLPQFNKPKETSIDREAVANLKLIQAAERIYKLEATFYINATDSSQINDRLRLAVPTSAGSYWNYKVETPEDYSLFTAKAQRTTTQLPSGESQRVKCIRQNDDEPFTTDCSW
ncbi:MAG: prepilin-type N-terminal cleavage/methylation domain-containing protein [Candidatus Omnitrophota bacterium]